MAGTPWLCCCCSLHSAPRCPPHPPACHRQAHKGSTLCYHVTGLDMGFDNPVFAAIELDYAEADQVRGAGMASGWSSCVLK